MASRYTFTALKSTFVVDSQYQFVKELGQGAYGAVVAAAHQKTGEGCAIKKITHISSKITCLYDMDIVFQPNGEFHEVYIYEELMEADLHSIIRSGQALTDAHYQSFIYQILCGLKYIHSANVLHRDIKPGNLLVNSECDLKICDFGLARGHAQGAGNEGFMMSEYVATRWYRAPEIMLGFGNYSTAIDVWSVGCILAELLGGKPIFKGRDYVDQLNQIIHYVGTPSEATLRRISSPRVCVEFFPSRSSVTNALYTKAQDYIRAMPSKEKVPFSSLFPDANPLAVDLLSQMLCFDPAKRISCEQALGHPYFYLWHDPTNEPVCKT
ncbi:hypothetical protein H0H93_006586, partial [Arthromyces matolae]